MSDIVVLSEYVANRIAAGEVVERPASVVKELVENSIDADATRIEILVEEGGKNLVVVTDNGYGIAPNQIYLALTRHATSKISDADDLRHINTLGFRGEALPSIASISRIEIISRNIANELGAKAIIDHGKILDLNEVGAQIGTTVRVAELFYNTPARRKFLKTAITEFGHVLDICERVSAAYPRVAFVLKHGSKVHMDFPRVNTYKERLIALWGSERVSEMKEIEAGEPGVAVFGFAAPPNIHWGSRRNIRFVLNGRPIESKTLSAAIKRAYEGTLPSGQFPQVMLYLEVDPELVDINVHPMKLEVRFRRTDSIFKAVTRAISSAIEAKADGHFFDIIRKPGSFSSDFTMRSPQNAPANFDFESPQREKAITEHEIFSTPTFYNPPRNDRDEGVLPAFWQIHRTYIFAETKGGIIIIDQHAAHERILYEEILERLHKEPGVGQRLLFPIAIKLNGFQETTLDESRESLESLGFEFGPTAPGHILVEAVPQEIPHFGEGKALLEMLDDIADGGAGSSAIEEFAALAACHMAIKAGDKMTSEEMAYLFDRLFATQSPYTCPHGRPTIVKISIDELEKRFERK
ncbi:DNA mismatch repair endonuclease MutL [bacterium]|nr:DNA mismatch repair endonuclease MutL [bacterium]